LFSQERLSQRQQWLLTVRRTLGEGDLDVLADFTVNIGQQKKWIYLRSTYGAFESSAGKGKETQLIYDALNGHR
jgi:hypothetical protein